MTEPIVLEFSVASSPERAFRVWTEECARWWPSSHCMSGQTGFDVVFEPHPGGRIYERGADGTEHDWGRVEVWDPPDRLRYSWHIFLEPERATTVEVTFAATGEGTLVRLENGGFDVFGEGADERADRVGSAWSGITGEYRLAI